MMTLEGMDYMSPDIKLDFSDVKLKADIEKDRLDGSRY